MFKQEYYIKASEQFGCSIGVAHTVTYKTKEESQAAFTPESFRKLDDEIKVNQIIQDVIDEEAYPRFMREVLRLEKEMRKGTKPITIYKMVKNGKSCTTS